MFSRYLILSYQSEFEKVHYPLPLNYEEEVENEKLKTTIRRMKTELVTFKNGVRHGASFDELGSKWESR
jgi:coiled-coil domain-containing protein 61